MIPPRTEFVLISAVLAFALTLGAFVLVAGGSDTAQWGRAGQNSLTLSLAAFAAALLGTWLTTLWHQRALRRQKRWTGGGMTLRTLLLSFCWFPIVLAIGFGAMIAIESWGNQPESGWVWIIPTVLLFTGFAIVLGAVPAFIIEYFVCRRYLRRMAGVNTGSA